MNAEKTNQHAVRAMASAQNIGDLSAQPIARAPVIGRDPGWSIIACGEASAAGSMTAA
jgi:hypothetical protein